jgi:excisionase family DNA binding protein
MTFGDQGGFGGEYEFLTTDDVLGYLRINARTVYRLIKNGDIPAVRIGRQWRIRRCDLDSWLNGQRLVMGK